MNVRIATAGDARAIAEVRVATWLATYRGIISDNVLDGLSVDRDEGTWRSHMAATRPDNFILVFETENNGITGFAACGPEREGYPGYDGEIYALYVHPEMQRNGCGRMLLQAATSEFMRRGTGSMLIWALTKNPYREFYAACGGVPALHRMITIGGEELEETGYCWPDLRYITR